MLYRSVRLAALGHELPPNVVTSAMLEDALAPVYEQLGLNPGRIELLSGVRERRFWDPGTSPSSVSVRSGRAAIERSGVEAGRIGAVIHASVCRDFLEPATANVVADALGVSPGAMVFDLSNACLGFMNGITLLANMVELGQIEAGLVVATEDGRPLVDATVADLVRRVEDGSLGRRDLRPAFASLTIGSGSVAAVVCRDDLSPRGGRLLGGAVQQATEHHRLCRSAPDQGFAGGGAHPLMETEGERVLENGCALAQRTWDRFEQTLGWTRETPSKLFCHQVGASYRKALLAALALDPRKDHPTLDRLGNVGSVSCPISLSLALDEGRVAAGDRVAMLGIGSGLNCLMLGLEWTS
ncbi:MAG: 3-oxoacyl-ACP synthase III [Planctomycetota bacterium]|nr:3-oxoacyl-ACP synthase III [Planctomycetota bacterium]